MRTAGERLRAWLGPQRSAAVLLSILGLASLGLAITGLYSLLAQLVAQRSAEIAVRMALGATRPAVAGMLMRQIAWLILAGTAAGMAASAAVTRMLGSAAGPIDHLDGITAASIATLLAAVGAAATLVPAYRAWRIDPAGALRSE